MLLHVLWLAAGILLWGVSRGFGLPVTWAGSVSKPGLAAPVLFAGACLLAAVVLTGGPRRRHGGFGHRSMSAAAYWFLGGFIWAALWGAAGTGDAWQHHGSPVADWHVRWTAVSPAGSSRPWEGRVISRAGVPVRGRIQFWPPAECTGRTDATGTPDAAGTGISGHGWLPGDVAVLPARLVWPEGPHNPGQADARVSLATSGLTGRLLVGRADWCGIEPEPDSRAWSVARWAEQGRRLIWRPLVEHLGPDWAGLAGGLLLGRSDQVPAPLRQAFRESGALHLMAVSGTHLSLVVAPLWPLLRRQRRLWWLPLVVGLGYVWLSGASPSAVRAGMQLILTLGLRRWLGDRPGATIAGPADRLQPWALAMAFTLAWDPLALFRPALQLSLAACAGICLWAAPWRDTLEARWGGGRLATYAAEGLAVGLAAQTAVLPLSLVLFGGFAPAGFVSSLYLLPVTGFVMYALLIAVPIALLLPGLGGVALAAPALLLRALAGLALASERLPLGYLWWPTGPAAAIALLCLFGAGSRLWPWPGRRSAAVAVAAGIVWQLWLPAIAPDVVPDVAAGLLRPAVTVTFLDVGQGDGIVIRAPNGQVTLVDGGGNLEWIGSGGGSDPGQQVLLPYLRWARVSAIDRIIVSHAHSDHVGGLTAVLAAVPVREIIEPGEPDDLGGETAGAAYRRFRDAVAEAGVPRRTVTFGEWLDLGGGLQAQVLGPPKPPLVGTRSDLNSNSIVLMLRYGNWQALLTGDMEAPAEDFLLAQGIDLQVHLLKVAHHGSNYSTQPAWLAATQPDVAVISAGRSNPFGHPGEETLARLADRGICTLRTDTGGAVTLRTDGHRSHVWTFHGGAGCQTLPRRLVADVPERVPEARGARVPVRFLAGFLARVPLRVRPWLPLRSRLAGAAALRGRATAVGPR